MDGLDLTTGEANTGLTGYGIRPKKNGWFPRWHKFSRRLPFIVVVVIPTLLVAIYYVFFAADQFTSEAKFVVRGPTAASPGMISSLLQTAGIGRAQDDTYAVQEYILSRDALTDLVKNDSLLQVFSRPEADTFVRFPLFFRGSSFEHLYEYYLKHVEVDLDSTTSVSKLVVKTFRAEDSQKIANALLADAEGLVNRINDRQRENAMRNARKEVALAEKRVQDVATDIASFRNKEQLLDPGKQSVPMLQGIYDLKQAMVRTQVQISQLQASSPHSPLLSELRERLTALQAQIDQSKTQITGPDSSLVPKITAYDMLTLQREFADKALASATSSLEAARISAEQQLIYLDPVVSPNKADYPEYPKKIASTSIVFFTLLGTYAVLSLLLAGAREHKVV